MKHLAPAAALLACAALIPVAATAQPSHKAPARAPAKSAPAKDVSQTYAGLQSLVTSVDITSITPDKTYNGIAYVKVAGTVHGQVGINDFVAVHNLIDHKQAANPAGAGTDSFPYESNFELIAPAAGQPQNEVLYIDSENRGSAISQSALGGFLQTHATSYARVQWQAGISKGVPADTQGVGLVIMRDFARWLGGRTPTTKVNGDYRPTPYRKMILGGISQSAWFVNTFIAEGFNAEPVTFKRVFDAAVAVDGAGNWLAINQTAVARNVAVETPYVDPNGVPLAREEMLRRPGSDPLYVDVANYTDFYRVRAGLTSLPYSSASFRRYDWPSPHAVAGGAQCNNGQPVTLNTLRYSPYLRAVVWNVEKAIGVKAAAPAPGLPPSTIFTLGDPPAASDLFNPLPGVRTPVPKVDASGMPVGGVRFPEADHPTGRPEPVALSPVVTTSISALCGNSGGWKPFTSQELVTRYKEKTSYLAAYQASLDALIQQGYLLAEDKAAMLKAAEGWWTAS
jgi:hypothetical protein